MNDLSLAPVCAKPDFLNRGAAEYASFLLTEIFMSGVFTPYLKMDISHKFSTLLQYQIFRYTKNESSSVAEEKAAELWEAILFTIGFYLKTIPYTIALEKLACTPPCKLLEEGRELLFKEQRTLKHLWNAVKTTRVLSQNIHYNALYIDGIPPFFRFYDAWFAAHETPGNITYPLAKEPPAFSGAEYIRCYLQNLLHENRITGRFPQAAIQRVMWLQNPLHTELPINLAQPVLLCAAACRAMGESIYPLSLSPASLIGFENFINEQTSNRLISFFKNSAKLLCYTMNLKGAGVQTYIFDVLCGSIPQLKAAAQNHNLGNLFPVEGSFADKIT